MTEQGLRQKKKARTHAQIVEAALKAFLKNGYENTTLEQIAEAADVTKRTLLRYFPTKTHLVLWGQYDALDTFKTSVAERGSQSIVDVWEEHVAVNSEWYAKHGAPTNARAFASTEPAITPANLAIQSEYQDLIFNGLIEEFGGNKENEILFSVVAAALVGGNYHVASLYIGKENYKHLPKAEQSVIELVKNGLLKSKAKKRT